MERPYRRMIRHPDFEVPVPGPVSVIGFFVVWAISGVMVAALALLAAWIRGAWSW